MKEKTFLQMQAYNAIKNSILSGELQPEQLYSETRMSAQIGVSRTPMREALQCLAQDGYITIIPSKGFMLRQLSEKDRKDSVEVRCAIEGYCTTVIAAQVETAPVQQLMGQLEEKLRAMDTAREQHDLDAFITNDHQFHLLLVGFVHNEEFDEIFQRLLYLIRLTSQDALSAEGRLAQTVQEHRDYYDALRQGDGAKAYQIMLRHLTMPLKLHTK